MLMRHLLAACWLQRSLHVCWCARGIRDPFLVTGKTIVCSISSYRPGQSPRRYCGGFGVFRPARLKNGMGEEGKAELGDLFLFSYIVLEVIMSSVLLALVRSHYRESFTLDSLVSIGWKWEIFRGDCSASPTLLPFGSTLPPVPHPLGCESSLFL